MPGVHILQFLASVYLFSVFNSHSRQELSESATRHFLNARYLHDFAADKSRNIVFMDRASLRVPAEKFVELAQQK